MCKYMKYVFKVLLGFIIGQLFLGVIWFNNSFVKSTVESKLFCLLTPLSGTESVYSVSYIVASIIPSILISLGLLLITRKRNQKRIYSILLIVSCFFTFWQFGVFEYVCKNIKSSSFIEENYVNPNDVKIEFLNKKNLIYIVLESVENTYASKETGGYMKDSLIPNLTQIANDNINFSNTNKLGGSLHLDETSFTIASILAQMSGAPLKIDIDMIHRYDFKKFYKGITLGDILYKNGYENYIIMGSDSGFGDYNMLYNNHHYHVSDLNTVIEQGKMTKDDIVWWGYSDSDLFKYAKEDLIKISKEKKPFNYVINTMNTHFEGGYVEKDCKEIFGNQYHNVIYNNDSMVNDFINWVKNQDFYENTVIIIVGDHITTDFGFCKNLTKILPQNYNRTTYNVFINAEFDKNMIKNKNRLFTAFDMFPTTISAIGGKIEGDRLGLGTNLFSDKKTIIERYGYEKVQEELNKRSSFHSSLMGTR